MEKLGYKAAQNLLEMIKNPRFDGTYEFDVHITERDSVRELQTAKSVQDGMQYQT
jgi:DNA-binding LacI/PurR family transcriptional regulator